MLRVAVQKAVLTPRSKALSPLLDVVCAGVEEGPGGPHCGHHGGRQGGDDQTRLHLGHGPRGGCTRLHEATQGYTRLHEAILGYK